MHQHPGNAIALAFVLSCLAAAPAGAFDARFLNQAPIRFMNDADIAAMQRTVQEVLEEAKDGETRTWENPDSGNSGSVTAVESFARDDLPCRRIELVNHAERATAGEARSVMDLCRVEGTWKLLSMPH